MRVAFAIGGLACAVVWACSSFDDAEEKTPDADSGIANDGVAPDVANASDGSANDGGASNDGGDASIDGATTTGTVFPACPRPPAPKCLLANCPRRKLYSPTTTGTEWPFAIATDTSYVYWTTLSAGDAGDAPYDGRGNAKIMRIGRSGNDVATVLAQNQRNTIGLAAVGDFLYWGAMNAANTAELRRVRRDCTSSCNVETVATLGGALISHLFGANATTIATLGDDGIARVVDVGSGVVTNSFAIGGYPAGTQSQADVIFGAGLASTIYAVSTGAITALASYPDAGADSGLLVGAAPIATDCANVYAHRGNGKIWNVPVAGGTAAPFTSVTPTGIFDFATDSSWLYAAAPDGPGLYAIALDGGGAMQLAGGNVHRVTVDALGIYWGDHDKTTGGAIYMIDTR